MTVGEPQQTKGVPFEFCKCFGQISGITQLKKNTTNTKKPSPNISGLVMIGDTPRCFQPPQIYRAPSDFNIHHLQPPTSSNRHIPSGTPKIPGPSRKLDPFNSTLQGINISHQTGKTETHRLKTALVSGICDRSQEGFFHQKNGIPSIWDQVSSAPGTICRVTCTTSLHCKAV